jgi:hypothetical protein
VSSAQALSLKVDSGEPGLPGRQLKSARHVLSYDRTGAPSAFGWRHDEGLWVEVPDVATFHLPDSGAVLTAFPDESADWEAVQDAYYGAALPLVVQATRGLEVLHASAVLVAAKDRAAAFCGISESGKSTVAYGLAGRGHLHWSDDALAFRMDPTQGATAVGLPFTAKLRENSAELFGVSPDRVEVMEGSQWKSAPLGVVFLLDPADAERSEVPVLIDRLSPADALHALLPNAYRFRPQTDERRRETMRSYLELVASVPIFGVRFPRGLARLPELLDELEQRVLALP